MPGRVSTSKSPTVPTLSRARAVFLAKLAETCQVAKAARYARVDRSTVYDWRKADPEFAKAWDAALEVGGDMLEDEAVKRAMEGSDGLLTLLLKAHRPEKYRERSDVQITADLNIAEGLQAARERARRAGS